MLTKRQIVNEIFKLTEDEKARKKLKNNWHYLKFLGLDFNCNKLKYAMAIDLTKFKKIEYIFLLQDIKKVLA